MSTLIFRHHFTVPELVHLKLSATIFKNWGQLHPCGCLCSQLLLLLKLVCVILIQRDSSLPLAPTKLQGHRNHLSWGSVECVGMVCYLVYLEGTLGRWRVSWYYGNTNNLQLYIPTFLCVECPLATPALWNLLSSASPPAEMLADFSFLFSSPGSLPSHTWLFFF